MPKSARLRANAERASHRSGYSGSRMVACDKPRAQEFACPLQPVMTAVGEQQLLRFSANLLLECLELARRHVTQLCVPDDASPVIHDCCFVAAVGLCSQWDVQRR